MVKLRHIGGTVSIHARHYWRASQTSASATSPTSMFQSTPAITGERALMMPVAVGGGKMFQSTPAITGERAPPSLPSVPASGSASFNPRPPLLASEPLNVREHIYLVDVSIHARHYWRASPRCPACPRPGQPVSIHARHYWRASPPLPVASIAPPLFQSTPAITGERAVRPAVAGAKGQCFNPRPPLLASEPRAGRCRAADGRAVSIHARHYWRASPPVPPVALLLIVFQSTPAITGERAPKAPTTISKYWCFNPRPPLLASEPAAQRHDAPAGLRVSIHARHYWRASRCGR